MIASIAGRIVKKGTDQIVVERGGIGFLVEMPMRLIASLPPAGEDATVFTYLYVRENELALFGFCSEDEKKLFQLLQTVSGVGPKLALQIVDAMTPGAFALAVLQEDIKRLTEIRGVGKKGAGRLVLELKDKLKKAGVTYVSEGMPAASGTSKTAGGGLADEVTAALAVLGYSSAEARDAVRRAEPREGDTAETLLKRALRQLAIV